MTDPRREGLCRWSGELGDFVMSLTSRVFSLWRNIVQRDRAERDLDDEVRAVFDLLVDEKTRAGTSLQEARRVATLEFGRVEVLTDQVRDVRAGATVDAVLQDVRYAARLLRRNPLFTLTAVMSLAVGIGINSAAFSVARAALLRSWPATSPARLVGIRSFTPQGPDANFSYADYQDLASRSRTLQGVIAYSRHVKFLRVGVESHPILYDLVSPNYFAVLGVRAAHGRTFLSSDASEQPAVVISDHLWQAALDADRSILGKPIVLSGRGYVVLGVTPRGFRGLERGVPTDLWLPITAERSGAEVADRRQREFQLLGRLRPGKTAAQARAELEVLGRQLEQAHPEDDHQRAITVVSESDRLRRAIVPTVLLMTAVGLVLLISCANVAGLLLARSETRRKETALRLALGASPWRLVRQLLTESTMLASAGAAVGLLMAWWLLRLQPALMPPFPFELGFDLRMDRWIIAFTLAASVMAVLVFGLVPALHSARLSLVAALKDDGRNAGQAGRPLSARNLFVTGEIALAVVLVTASILLGRSLLQSQTIPLGIDTSRQLAFFDLLPGVVSYDGQRSLRFFDAAADRVRSIPGVERVSVALRVPLSSSGGGAERRVSIPGVTLPQNQPSLGVKFNGVAANYFGTIGTRLLRGRTFVPSDRASGVRPAVISETMARRFWPGADVLGRHIVVEGHEHEVVGVVEDVKINDVHEPPEPYLYVPFAEAPSGEGTLIVEIKGDPRAVIATVRDRIHNLDRDVPVSVRSVDDLLQLAFYEDRMATGLAAVLGTLGMLLAAVGLYGVIAHRVRRRRHEIGVRMALGAGRYRVIWLVLAQGLRLAAIGIGAGLIASLGVTRLMSSLLYGVKPTDPLAFAVSGGIVVIVAIGATCFPACRAVKLDPIVALRCE